MLISQELIDQLSPSEAAQLFDTLIAINDEKYEMNPIIARALDELDAAMNRLG